MNTNFEMWVADCERNNIQIYQLDYDKHTDIGIYMIKIPYGYKGNYQYYNSYDSPLYQLWIGDKRSICMGNYQEVYKIWERLVSAGKDR